MFFKSAHPHLRTHTHASAEEAPGEKGERVNNAQTGSRFNLCDNESASSGRGLCRESVFPTDTH